MTRGPQPPHITDQWQIQSSRPSSCENWRTCGLSDKQNCSSSGNFAQTPVLLGLCP